jgi:hypothetical protein
MMEPVAKYDVCSGTSRLGIDKHHHFIARASDMMARWQHSTWVEKLVNSPLHPTRALGRPSGSRASRAGERHVIQRKKGSEENRARR